MLDLHGIAVDGCRGLAGAVPIARAVPVDVPQIHLEPVGQSPGDHVIVYMIDEATLSMMEILTVKTK